MVVDFPLSGTVNWRVWALTSTSVHLLILLVCFAFVYCDCWPTFHHRRMRSIRLGDRIKIKQVVAENWEELLTCAKDLIDAKLEDGEKLIFSIRKLALKVPCNNFTFQFSCSCKFRFLLYRFA